MTHLLTKEDLILPWNAPNEILNKHTETISLQLKSLYCNLGIIMDSNIKLLLTEGVKNVSTD